jgi:hypothetical protein
MKMQLHRSYGPGLRDLYNPVTKDINMAVFNKGKKSLSGASYAVDGTTINPDDKRSFVLGVVAGQQFNLDFLGDCFYTALATTDSLDYFTTDFANLQKYGQYYNLFFYDPVHIYSNLLATYE